MYIQVCNILRIWVQLLQRASRHGSVVSCPTCQTLVKFLYLFFFYFGFGQLRSKAVERRRTTLSRKTAVLLAAVIQFQARKARTVQHIRYFFVLTNKSESWLWHVYRENRLYRDILSICIKKPASIFQSSKSRF